MRTCIICLATIAATLASALAIPPAKQRYIFHKDLATRHPTPMVLTEWNLTANQVEVLLKHAERYIRNHRHTKTWRAIDLKYLKENYDRYSVQAIGTMKDGKKVVHLNFFRLHRSKDPELDDGWDYRYDYFWVGDGGADFWQVDYDVASKSFVRFSINGGA